MRVLNFINVAIAACVPLGIVACHSDKQPKASSPVPVVDVMVVKPRPVSNLIEVNGSIIANQYVGAASGSCGPYHVPQCARRAEDRKRRPCSAYQR